MMFYISDILFYARHISTKGLLTHVVECIEDQIVKHLSYLHDLYIVVRSDKAACKIVLQKKSGSIPNELTLHWTDDNRNCLKKALDNANLIYTNNQNASEIL